MNYVHVLATTICANCREESPEIYMHGVHFQLCFECGEHEQAWIEAAQAKETADECCCPSVPHVR